MEQKACIEKRLTFGRHKHGSVPRGIPEEKISFQFRRNNRAVASISFSWHVTEFVCRKRLIEHNKRYVLTMLKEFSADMHV